MDATNIIQFGQESSKMLLLGVFKHRNSSASLWKYVGIVLGISIIFVRLDNFV